MLIIKNIQFIKKDNILYLVGSSPNQLYINHIEQMGKITLLAWIKEDPNAEIDKLVPLLKSEQLKVLEVPITLSFFDKVKRIKQAVKEAKCLSIKFCFIDSFIACHYARKYGKPYVIESGTDAFTSSWYHGGSIKYKLFALPYEWLTRYYHAKAKNIIYVSKFFLQNKYPSKAIQVGCSDTVLSDVPQTVLDKRLNKILGSSEISLGLIGSSTVEYRGHDTLIEVMYVLRERGYNVNVRFAGSAAGKDKRIRRASELKVENYVFFDGYLNQSEIYHWIDGIDILVMPTLQETLGRAVIESMSRGCPVIGSSETALPEQLGSDCVVSAKNIPAIVSIIEHMINDKEYMKLCAIENFWRAKKYNSKITNRIRKQFYDNFYQRNGLIR